MVGQRCTTIGEAMEHRIRVAEYNYERMEQINTDFIFDDGGYYHKYLFESFCKMFMLKLKGSGYRLPKDAEAKLRSYGIYMRAERQPIPARYNWVQNRWMPNVGVSPIRVGNYDGVWDTTT
jgi:hypothetical protein